MKTVLTQRQKEVLEFIKKTVEQQGMPPTVAEITTDLGVSSTNGIRGHLQALARKGAIELVPNASRGIRLLGGYQGADNAQDGNEEEGLPVIGRVAAGSPILAAEHIEDHYKINPDQFKPRAHYLLRVQGMSMRDVGILDGDLLAVHSTSTAENGQIVVARLEDEVTVKRLKKKDHMIYLKAENPDFETIKVDFRKQHIEIEGVAVGLLRYL
ncbi:MAG: transcriptional repressor LexA [Gammaproteobacteria bacterium]|nr:transcriptional repressor LexA [Gammaproteobacteria bacterium]